MICRSRAVLTAYIQETVENGSRLLYGSFDRAKAAGVNQTRPLGQLRKFAGLLFAAKAQPNRRPLRR
jgi:hypothetical protein